MIQTPPSVAEEMPDPAASRPAATAGVRPLPCRPSLPSDPEAKKRAYRGAQHPPLCQPHPPYSTSTGILGRQVPQPPTYQLSAPNEPKRQQALDRQSAATCPSSPACASLPSPSSLSGL